MVLALPAQAQDLTLPAQARSTFTETRALASHRVATGPFRDSLPSVTAEGAVTRQVWQVPIPQGTLDLLAPLRDQLEADGWAIIFSCATRACGGFDFRFEIDVTPAPEMFVDLSDFRYLAARKSDAWTTLLVSRSGDLGYIQTTLVDPEAEVETTVKSASAPVPPPARQPQGDLAEALRATGRAVLADLVFETGSTDLSADSYPSLAALAEFLTANPETTIALVGHTDAEGGAEGNMAISRRRAQSARTLLIERYGIAANRVETHGVGFFAPITRNDTPEGRETNRRVEAVITSTE